MTERAAAERFEIATVAKRPDLLPVIADWLWHEWWKTRGRSWDETHALYAECTATLGPPQTLILLADDVPIGTVTLARNDLDVRPNLTPWLAGVFMIPERRWAGICRPPLGGVR